MLPCCIQKLGMLSLARDWTIPSIASGGISVRAKSSRNASTWVFGGSFCGISDSSIVDRFLKSSFSADEASVGVDSHLGVGVLRVVAFVEWLPS